MINPAKSREKNLNINIATVNGSGSQSANKILLKSLFRKGYFVGGKNIFPSNIAGLPTWFRVRVNEKGYVSYESKVDILVTMQSQSLIEDLKSLKPNSLIIYNSDLKLLPTKEIEKFKAAPVPFKTLAKKASDSIKLRKFLENMIYVGVLSQILGLDLDLIGDVTKDHFKSKPDIISLNIKSIEIGYNYAKENFSYKEINLNSWNKKSLDDQILIDGNAAAALGLVFGGCSLVSWYPITPSSSLAENFEKYASQLRKDEEGKNKFAVVQAEDELGAIFMVVGAGWTGARAATVTSGPGLSLMAEAAGLSYFAEVPSVIWDVQRAGPSTGLPTRTMQGDLSSASSLSHGDTEHIVLLPSSPQECFEFGQICFDLAERFQTLVIVLSDLDLGMNLHRSSDLQFVEKKYDRGKILNEKDLSSKNEFHRYKDLDGDGICYRTLPGTPHPQAAYFTRGTGHDDSAKYSENPEDFSKNLDRLKKKIENARNIVPEPYIQQDSSSDIGLIAYGSTDAAIKEIRDKLLEKNIPTNYLRIKALPLHQKIENFINKHKKIFIVEQNRDGQMKDFIAKDFPKLASKLYSVTQYNGLPIEAERIVKGIGDHCG